MTMNLRPSRRQVLAAAATGGAGALAACSSSGSTAGAPSSAPKSASSEVVAKLADVAVGESVSVKLPDGTPGILSRPARRTVVCFSAVCPHQGCTVAPHGAELECPCHGSVFDPKTGVPRSGPAPSPLARLKVRIDGAEIVTA